MNIHRVKLIIKWFGAALLICVYSNSSVASPDECIAALYKYGNEFTPEMLGKTVASEFTQKPNEHLTDGELVYFAAYKSGESWLTTRECNSCNPKKMTTGVYLAGNRPFPCDLKEGFSASQVMQVLGEADDKQDEEYLFYYLDETQENIVAIHLVEGKMKALQLFYYQG